MVQAYRHGGNKESWVPCTDGYVDVGFERGREGSGEAAEGWEARAASALEDLRATAPLAWEPLSIKVRHFSQKSIIRLEGDFLIDVLIFKYREPQRAEILPRLPCSYNGPLCINLVLILLAAKQHIGGIGDQPVCLGVAEGGKGWEVLGEREGETEEAHGVWEIEELYM